MAYEIRLRLAGPATFSDAVAIAQEVQDNYPMVTDQWGVFEVDTSSSASRQHYIDTGEYLPVEES